MQFKRNTIKKSNYRCTYCRRLLFIGQISHVEIKCPRCRNMVYLK